MCLYGYLVKKLCGKNGRTSGRKEDIRPFERTKTASGFAVRHLSSCDSLAFEGPKAMFRGAKAKPSRLHKACFATEMGAVGRRNNARGQQLSDYKPIAKTRENGVFGDQWEVEQKNSVD